MNKLILTAALLALATPAFAEQEAAPQAGEHETMPTTIETTLADDISGTEAHMPGHDMGDMFDEAAPTAEQPAAE